MALIFNFLHRPADLPWAPHSQILLVYLRDETPVWLEGKADAVLNSSLVPWCLYLNTHQSLEMSVHQSVHV